jgi:hypothetical protein
MSLGNRAPARKTKRQATGKTSLTIPTTIPTVITPAPTGKQLDYATMIQACQGLGTEAIDTLAYLMRSSKHESIKAACANAILDRGYGKPYQSVSVTTNQVQSAPTKLDTVPITDLDAMRRAMRQAMAITANATMDQGLRDVTESVGLDGKPIQKRDRE